MIGFWSTPHLLLGESVFSLIQRKSASQHYSFLFATQQLFSSFNVVFSKGPARTANMEVLRSCPSHFWQSSFRILIFLTVIYLFSFFTSLFWLYSAIWCSSNLPRTLFTSGLSHLALCYAWNDLWPDILCSLTLFRTSWRQSLPSLSNL